MRAPLPPLRDPRIDESADEGNPRKVEKRSERPESGEMPGECSEGVETLEGYRASGVGRRVFLIFHEADVHCAVKFLE